MFAKVSRRGGQLEPFGPGPIIGAMAQLPKGTIRALGDLTGTVAGLGGVWLILGDRITGPHRWWGALIGSLSR